MPANNGGKVKLIQNYSLKTANTMGLAAIAECFVRVESEAELREALDYANQHQLAVTVLGGGSNVLIPARLAGLVIQPGMGSLERDSETITAGAGVNWHELVRYSLGLGLSGLENLSYIPGSVGAAPIQNIGAYGVELEEHFLSLRAINIHTLEGVILDKRACQFSYRNSWFKEEGRDQFIITEVTFGLSSQFHPTLGYPGLENLLDHPALTPLLVSDRVVELRRRKLPDPEMIGNSGSFFKNPIVPAEVAVDLQLLFPHLPVWPDQPGSSKLSAAWLIENAGLKGMSIGGATVSEQHALVIVNQQNADFENVIALADEVISRVFQKYDIRLQIEPQVLSYGLGL